MSVHADQLTNVELERLGILVEELGEVCQIVGKIIRHGLESKNPTISDSPTNREYLQQELGDVKNAVNMLVEEDIVSQDVINQRAEEKSISIQKWLHHVSKHRLKVPS